MNDPLKGFPSEVVFASQALGEKPIVDYATVVPPSPFHVTTANASIHAPDEIGF